ncbi:MAG: hypothetical protein R2685_07805 [Candidatus Nitrosocosmicus sp.]|nr:hypothetical protein [Candidatus Nitrosocosmicus sp.]
MSSSNSGSKGSGDFPITITARDVGIDQSISKLTRFADVIKTLDSQIKAFLTSMNSYQNLFNSFGRNFNTVNQGFNQGAQGAQRFNQAMQQNVNTLRQGQTTLNQFMNAQKQTVSTTQQASAAETNLTQNTQRMNQAFAQTSATLGRAQGQMMNLNRNAQQTANTMRNATANTRMYDEAIFENNNALNHNNMATESHTKSTKNNTDAIINNMRHISALGMGFMMLSNTMSDSQLVQENIAMQEERLAEAHKRTAEALKEHGKASTQYQQAAQSESKIERGLAFERREATAQQHNMLFMQAMIASEIMSSAVPALLRYKETANQVSGAFKKLKTAMTATNVEKAFTGLSNALSAIPGKLRTTVMGAEAVGGAMANAEIYTARTTKQMGALSTVQPAVAGGFRGILAAASPFLFAIVGIGLALVAIASDFMGVRTSLEQFGLQLGTTVPVLYPFLEGIQGIGAALGLTGESAEEAKKHFDNAGRGFANIGTLWNDTVADMQSSNNRLVSSMGDLASTLGRDITQAAGKLDTQLKATVDTWNQFVDALGRGDYKTATDLIISSFESLPSIIGTALSSLGTISYNAFANLVNTIRPIVEGIGRELGSRLLTAIQQGWSDLTNWINTNFVTPVKNTILDLPNQITELGTKIVKKLLSGDYAAELTSWASQVWADLNKSWHDFITGQGGDKITEPVENFIGTGQSSGLKPGDPGYYGPNDPGTLKVNPGNKDQIAEGFKQAYNKSGGVLKTPAPTKIAEPVGPFQQPDKNVPEPVNNVITPSNTGNKAPNPYAINTNQKKTLPVIGGVPKATASGQPSYAVGQSTTAQATAIDDQTTKLKKLAEAQDEATTAGANFLLGHQKIAAQLPNNTAQITAISAALTPFVEENDKLSTTLDNNALALQHNALQGELQRKGMLEQRKAYQDMQMQVEENRGSLKEYADQVEEGTIFNYAFTLGQQEQRKALLDAKVEVANTTGMLQEYALQLESGEAQSVAFAQGQLEIVKQFDDTITETANLNGQFKLLAVAMNSTGAAQIMYNNGLAKGRVETAQAIINIDAMRGSYDGTRQVLLAATKGHLDYTAAQKLSNDQLMEFISVVKGAPDALKNLADWMTNLGTSIRSNLADAMKEGKKEFNDAIDDLEDSLGFKLGKEVTTTLKFVAKVDEAKQKIMEGLGVISILISANADPSEIKKVGDGMLKEFESTFEKGGKNVGNGMIDNLKKQWQGREGEITALFNTIQQNIQTIMTAPPGSAEFIQAWEKLKLAMEAANGNLDSAVGLLNNANNGFSTLGATMSNAVTKTNEFGTVTVNAGVGLGAMATNTQQVGDSASEANPKLQEFYTTIQQFGTIEAVAQVIFEQNIPAHALTMVTKVTEELNKLPPAAAPSFGEIDSLSQTILETNVPNHASIMVTNVQTHFDEMKSNADSTLSDMESRAESSFQAQGDAAIAVAQGVSQHFSDAKAAGERIIGDLESSVKSSANTMADAFGKVADAVDNIGQSAQNAESDVDSLKKAVESLPNIDRTITYHIETVGSKPSGAQFGTNMLVDKPQMLLVGEGFGKERVKISPGTMPFTEDFSREMNNHFARKNSVISANGQPGQPGQSNNGTSTNNGTSISTPGQPGTNGTPGANGHAGISGVNNVYAPGSHGVPTNQNNNPDLGGGSAGMMISNNASLVQMNNANGKRMIVDGKTGTVIMLDGSQSSSNSNTNNTGTSSSNNGDIVGQNNNVNVDNDTNSKNNVYIPGSSGLTQSQSNSQSGSSGGQNYYYQSQTNNGQTKVNTNIPTPPGMINESAASSGNMPVSGSYSSDSRSRLLSRGDPFGFQHRVISETPVEVNVNVEGIKLAKALLKILNEQLGFGSGYYG